MEYDMADLTLEQAREIGIAAATCPICTDVARGTVEVACGHRFCGVCLRRQMEAMLVFCCPLCGFRPRHARFRHARHFETLYGALFNTCRRCHRRFWWSDHHSCN